MTLGASARRLPSGTPSTQDRAVANQLRRVLAAQSASGREQHLDVLDEAGHRATIALTPGMSGLLMELLRHVGAGSAVTLVPLTQMLTTQQAADILNVSRPHLISLLAAGRIAHQLVGRHRRIQADDLFAYKDARDAERAAALAELAAGDADLI